MSGVEALSAQDEFTDVPAADGGAGADTTEADLGAIWDRENVTNGADRGADGQFASRNGTQTNSADGQADQGSLEGEQGEGDQLGSTPVAGTPLPAHRLLSSLDAEWATLTPEVQAKLTERSTDLHNRMTQMGQQVAAYKPLQEVANEFAQYFNSELIGPDGQATTPADAVRYLANIQRSMDAQPLETLLSIADTYGLREQLAQAFGGQVQSVPVDQQKILNELNGLRQLVRQRQDPAQIEEVLERRDVQSEISRLASSKPHWSHVEADLPFFINKAKMQLGEGAARAALLERAYDLAVQADPALRQQTQAAPSAADRVRGAKAEGAKRAAGVNVPSSQPGKAREPSLDDALGQIWENSQSKG